MGILIGLNLPDYVQLPKNVSRITQNIHITIIESELRNRTLFLDPNQTYCEVVIFHGGNNPELQDLAYSNASIVFFFLEDIENQEKTDNYSDLIVRMNPVVYNNRACMCVVFFAEGGYDKLVYYRNQLIYNYTWNDTLGVVTSNYGIIHIDLETFELVC